MTANVDPTEVTTGDLPPSGWTRRRILRSGGVAAAGAALGAVGAGIGVHLSDTSSSPSAQLGQIPATENLMYEHGVLKRVLLIYEELGRRLGAGEAVPARTLGQAATVIHDYIESFHEALEEGYVFPTLRRAGVLVPTVDTLLLQHARGRLITQALLASDTELGHPTTSTRTRLSSLLASFVRMYQPHEAREDTVIFPAYRALLSDDELESTARLFSSLQREQFGPNGFADAVAQVTDIERTLGIEDLQQFTPAAVS